MPEKQQEQVRLPPPLRKRMLEHALATPAAEVCGLIGARDELPSSVYPVRNVAGDPVQQFLMDPEQQIEAMRRMRDAGEELWGIYHSHPDTAAEPSATDLRLAAYPDTYYFIISVATATPELNGFYFDGKGFRKVATDA